MHTTTAEPNVLLVYRAMIPSVRWFAYEQLHKLDEEGLLHLRARTECKLHAKDVTWADWVVFCRADTGFENWLSAKCAQLGRKLIYMLDDDLQAVPPGLDSATYYRDAFVRRTREKIMHRCDVLLTHSPLLATKYGMGFSHIVMIEQPSMTRPGYRLRLEGPVRIGFSGSLDRAVDVQAVLGQVLPALVDKYGERISIEFFGAEPPVAKALSLRCYPYTSSAEAYYQQMAELGWEIGLAPLPESPFYQSKYYNKFVEYASYGMAGVYTALPPYAGVVQDGVDGFLCRNSSEAWFECLCRLIEDAALREHVGREAARRAEDFSLDRVAKRLWKQMEPLYSFRAPPARLSQIGLSLARAVNGTLFLGQTLRRHGFQLVPRLWRRWKGANL